MFLGLSLVSAAALAQPSLPDEVCSPPAEQVLAALNALRAGARSCGAHPLPPAPLLRWDARLAHSARLYARELAQRETLSHDGLRSRSLRERLNQAGYAMRLGGENLAAGQTSLEEVLQQWQLSASHCEILMGAEFEQAGLACVSASQGRYRHYWVLHVGLGSDPAEINRP
jgi:uncharacterized protein YkwD